MKKSKFRALVEDMPPLRHSVERAPGEEFDIEKSEVMAWIMAQPGFKSWAFSQCTEKGIIVFNSELKYWHGKNFKSPSP